MEVVVTEVVLVAGSIVTVLSNSRTHRALDEIVWVDVELAAHRPFIVVLTAVKLAFAIDASEHAPLSPAPTDSRASLLGISDPAILIQICFP